MRSTPSRGRHSTHSDERVDARCGDRSIRRISSRWSRRTVSRRRLCRALEVPPHLAVVQHRERSPSTGQRYRPRAARRGDRCCPPWRCRRLHLEARETPALAGWYARHGFEVIRRLPDYYASGDDAVRMRLTLQSTELRGSPTRRGTGVSKSSRQKNGPPERAVEVAYRWREPVRSRPVTGPDGILDR